MATIPSELEQIQQSMIEGNIGPHEAAELKTRLAGEYSFAAGMLEAILARKPTVWLEIRKHKTSDAQADKEYERTPDGIDEIGLKLRLKRIATMMSALTSLIKVKEGEARSQW